MEHSRLTTAGRLGLLGAVLMYVSTLIMLFLPVCFVTYNTSVPDVGTLIGTRSVTFVGTDYLQHSGLHWFNLIGIFVLCTMSIPMFSDTQLNCRRTFIGIRCSALLIVLILMAAYVFDTLSVVRQIHPNSIVSIETFQPLTGGIVVMIFALLSTALNIVSTVLCAVVPVHARIQVFFGACNAKWRAEEVLIAVFVALTGFVVACIPYVCVKSYWKKKYGNAEVAGPPAARFRLAGTISYYSSTARLLSAYKNLEERGAITAQDYEKIKSDLLDSDRPEVRRRNTEE